MKKRFALLLCVFILAGCAAPAAETTEPAAVYDWMAGESPISDHRTGTTRMGLTNADSVVTANGTYFLSLLDDFSRARYILYVDHGSGELVKLCGRPDCPHGDETCNAYLSEPFMLTYYDGYLYALENHFSGEDCHIVRMDPDGSNRVELLNLTEFAREQGGAQVSCHRIFDGLLIFHLVGYTTAGSSWSSYDIAYYSYRLDGSEGAPRKLDLPTDWYFLTQNGSFIGQAGEPKDCEAVCGIYRWDPGTDTSVYLADHPGCGATVCEESCYFFREGTVWKLDYETGTETALVETDLAGEYTLFCMPECFLLSRNDLGTDNGEAQFYFYNWNGDLIDTISWQDSREVRSPAGLICAETAERIYLSKSTHMPPLYYIEKSELGTGKATIHALDIASDMANCDAFLEDWED